MACTQVRSKVGVVATTLGLAVLLAGPTSTLGLGVPTADGTTTQVTSSVQGAVDATTETATTTVTQVETTVQTTVQSTTEPVASQPAAPAPVASPTQTVSHATAPVKKQAAPPKRAPTTVTAAKQQVAAVSESARTTVGRRAATTREQPRPDRTAATRTRASDGGDPASQCGIPLLSLVPGGAELNALLAVVCDAADSLGLTSRIGLAPRSDSATPGLGVLGTSETGKPAPAHARAAAFGVHRTTGDGSRAAAEAASAAQPGDGVALLGVPVTGRGGAIGDISAVNAAHASPGSGGVGSHADSGKPHHHTWFSGQSRGTEILMAIIFANLVILGGIVLWRLAARWVLPRFA